MPLKQILEQISLIFSEVKRNVHYIESGACVGLHRDHRYDVEEAVVWW